MSVNNHMACFVLSSEDNVVYMFSSADEIESARMIERVLKEKLLGDSTMHYIVSVGERI